MRREMPPACDTSLTEPFYRYNLQTRDFLPELATRIRTTSEDWDAADQAQIEAITNDIDAILHRVFVPVGDNHVWLALQWQPPAASARGFEIESVDHLHCFRARFIEGPSYDSDSDDEEGSNENVVLWMMVMYEGAQELTMAI